MASDLTLKIKEDWGTVKRFCEKNNINYSTFKVVKSGRGKSSVIVKKLKSFGYIKNATDL